VRRFTILLLIATALLLSTACGGDEDGDGGAEISAEDALMRTEEAWQNVRSFHFRLTHENGSTEIPLNLQLTTAEGDFVLPDRLRAEVEAEAGNIDVSVNAIAIGDRTWITNPFTRRFQSLSGTISLRDIFDPAELVATAIGSIRNATIVGQESVDGVPSYRIRGELDSAVLTEALGIVEPGQVLEVELWSGVEDGLPRQVRLEGPLNPDEEADIARELRLSRFNETVDIQPP
jgi:hypothetical protein